MKAIDRPFTKIINGTTQFVIPVFQRDYSWTEDECEQIWKDVIRVAADPTERGHFLGSVVYVSTGDTSAGFTRWLLIDGQQRVTTITLLLAALRDHITETNWRGSEDGPTAKRVEAYFLKNVQEEGNRQHKLVLRRHDQSTLHALLDREEAPAPTSLRIKENYEYFRERLVGVDPEEVYRGVGRLIVVDVTLDRTIDDPQLIFESLNSTGMDLSQSDLIRNFILMRLEEREQTRLYETYWRKIENLFRGSEKTFDSFVRDYLALHTKASKQERSDRLYFAFRREFASVGSDTVGLDAFLAQLLRFARFHAAFSIGLGAPEALREPLARLRRQVDVPATVVMRLFECFDSTPQTLTEGEFDEAVALLESYVFRRAICGEQTRGYWQVFANLAYSISTESPLESLKVGLARQRDNYRFPTDGEFRHALEERDMYGKRTCFDLLERLENHGSNEQSDTTKYSIEHIMPQNDNLGPEWRAMLGEDWREVQKVWLHRLGNLTLTGYNSSYSDRPFHEKKSIPGGFEESSVRLNRFVRDQESWTAEAMAARGRELASRSLKIWPPLSVEASLIAAAQQAEIRALAQRRDVKAVPMSASARALFDLLRVSVMAFDADVVELAEPNSVSYHHSGFFLEVLPRKDYLSLLLPLEFNEIDDPGSMAKDVSGYKFVTYAVHEGGVVIMVRSPDDVERSISLVRQAWETTRA